MALTIGQAKPYIEQAQFGQSQATGQLQTAIQQASQGPGGGVVPRPDQIQKLAAETATASAQPVLQAQQAAAQQAQTAAGQAANAAKLERVRKIQGIKQDTAVKQREAEEKLFNLNSSLKSQLYDETMKFQRDELGRTSFNERQLADWAVMKARNEEDLMKYEQIASEAIQKKQMLMEQAWKVLEQDLQATWQRAEQEGDQALQIELRKMKQAYEKKRREAANRAAASGALWSGIGGALGAIGAGTAGFFASGGNVAVAGLAAQSGYTVGKGLGETGYSQFGDKPSDEL